MDRETKLKQEISIKKEDYIKLRMDEEILRRLEIGGVDNWDWYGESLNQEGDKSLDDFEEELTKIVELM